MGLISTNLYAAKFFFTVGDMANIGYIMWEWHSELASIREAYTRNNYWQTGKKEAERDIQAVNKIYMEKLTKVIAIALTTNIAGGAYLLRNKLTNSISAGKMVSGTTVGDALASSIVALFKVSGKTVNPDIIRTLSTGGLEAVKLFTEHWAANTDFKENIENAFVRGFLNYSEFFSEFAGWLVTILPKVGNLDLSVGKLGPADDAAMRKRAADMGIAPTPGAPPPGTPEKSMGGKIIDKMLGN